MMTQPNNVEARVRELLGAPHRADCLSYTCEIDGACDCGWAKRTIRAALKPDPVAGEVASMQARLRNAANNIEYTRNKASLGGLAGWEHQACREAADMLAALVHQQPPARGDAFAFYDFTEQLMHWMNATDSGEMTVRQFRSALNVQLLDMRPSHRHAPARDAALREAAAVAQFVADHEQAPRLADVAVAIRAGILALVGSDDVAGVRTSDEAPRYCVIVETVEASKGPLFYVWERGTGRYVVGKLKAEQASIIAGELNAMHDATVPTLSGEGGGE